MKRYVLTLILAGLTLSACRKHEVVEKPVRAVRTVAAEMNTTSTELRYSGVVAPDTQVDMAFRLAGYIERIGSSSSGREIEAGDSIGTGAVLARLRPAEYQTRVNYARAVAADAAASLSALRAQLTEADASLVQSTQDFDRASSLFEEKALTKADFDAATARRDAATARRNSAAAQLSAQQARIDGAAAQHEEAALSLTDTAVTAPFPGVVLAKRVARGSLVTAGSPAFTIADTRTVKISFGVPDLALRGFRLGDALTVLAEAAPGREFRGHVTTISPAADPSSRVFAVEISIPNADQALKVGMVATVIVSGAPAAPAPSIPLSAVVKSPSGYGVYTVDQRDGNDRVHLQPVTLGPVRGNAVLIASGVGVGQRVVATGGLQLADGEQVKQIP